MLKVQWMSGPLAPEQLLKVRQCKCTTGCGSMKCGCMKAGVKCSIMCKCDGCVNCDAGRAKADSDEEKELEDDPDNPDFRYSDDDE